MSGTSSSFINSFRYLPKELFRINNGRGIRLREWSVRRSKSYDLLAESGWVKPKALTPSTYSAPNGASMRPNTLRQHEILGNFKGHEVVVYSVPQGTRLPDDLILVHEHSDHYSLQAAVEMTVEELNTRITHFLESYGTLYTKEQWLNYYRSSIESDAEQSTAVGPSTSANSEYWTWSEQYGRYYHVNEDQSCEWYEEAGTGSSAMKSKDRKGKGKHR